MIPHCNAEVTSKTNSARTRVALGLGQAAHTGLHYEPFPDISIEQQQRLYYLWFTWKIRTIQVLGSPLPLPARSHTAQCLYKCPVLTDNQGGVTHNTFEPLLL